MEHSRAEWGPQKRGKKLRRAKMIRTAANIEDGVKLAARGGMVLNDHLIQIWMIPGAKLGIIGTLTLIVGPERLLGWDS